MILAEECKLRLGDAVDKWLPEMADRKVLKRIDAPLDETVSAQRPITVRDLLYGLMLPSGNDAAVVLAAVVPGRDRRLSRDVDERGGGTRHRPL